MVQCRFLCLGYTNRLLLSVHWWLSIRYSTALPDTVDVLDICCDKRGDFRMKPVLMPTGNMLEASVKNNILFYYVALFAWVGFLLYAQAYRDGWLLFDSMIFLVCACYFGLAQKIDKARLELLRRGEFRNV